MCSPMLGMVLLEPSEWSISWQLESSCHPTEHILYIYLIENRHHYGILDHGPLFCVQVKSSGIMTF